MRVARSERNGILPPEKQWTTMENMIPEGWRSEETSNETTRCIMQWQCGNRETVQVIKHQKHSKPWVHQKHGGEQMLREIDRVCHFHWTSKYWALRNEWKEAKSTKQTKQLQATGKEYRKRLTTDKALAVQKVCGTSSNKTRQGRDKQSHKQWNRACERERERI